MSAKTKLAFDVLEYIATLPNTEAQVDFMNSLSTEMLNDVVTAMEFMHERPRIVSEFRKAS